jgi:uncharacterized membrane protein YdcZ (DUF606 family)
VRRPGARRCTTVGLTRADPVSFVVGALVTLVAVIFTVRWSPATQEIMQHPEWMLVAGVAIGLMIFGIVAGMGWTVAGSINFAGENAIVRNFACGAALGAVALFGLGSHGAAHKSRHQRRSLGASVRSGMWCLLTRRTSRTVRAARSGARSWQVERHRLRVSEAVTTPPLRFDRET